MSSTPDRLKALLRPSGPKIAVFLGALIALFYAFSFGRPNPQNTFLGSMEGSALDVKMRLRGPLSPSGNVVVVAIDEASLARFGRWPWPRKVMAELIEGLTEAGARVIALDMAFTEEAASERRSTLMEVLDRHRASAGAMDDREGFVEDFERWILEELEAKTEDDRLAQAIFESGRVVWGLFAHDDPDIGPPTEVTRPAFERVRPFMVEALYQLEQGRERPDPVQPGDPTLELFEILAGIESPLPGLAAATPFFGFVNLDLDRDGVIRRTHVLGRHEGVLIPSLALTSVAAWMGSRIHPMRDDIYPTRLARVRLPVGSAAREGTLIRDSFGAGDWVDRRRDEDAPPPWEAEHLARYASWRERSLATTDDSFDIDAFTLPGFAPGDLIEIPLDPFQNGRLMINHIGKGRAFEVVGAVDVIEGRAEADQIAGRIAVVGVTAIGTHDQRVTPFDQMLPGVFVQASIMDSMITGRHLRRPWWMVIFESLLPLLIGLVVGLVMPRLTGGPAIAGFVAGGLIVIGGGVMGLFLVANMEMATFTPLATFLLLVSTVAGFQWVVVDKEKRYVRRAFQHYLAPSVLESVLKDPKKLALEPNKAELSVLFSDIRGFTSISERLTPEELATVLNEYLTPMTRVVFEHGGTLDKYMGDAVMAFWNDPIPQADHALRACQAAIGMQRVCGELNAAFEARGWPRIDIGVGVNTGTMAVGNFGSDVLFDYTVMGDAVNLASRLEGTNKQYGTRIIISEFTFAMVRDRVVARELDSVRVKGRSEPVRIFELLREGDPDEETASFVEAFSSGLLAYKGQRWEQAEAAFEECLRILPEDMPSKLYLGRCKEMRERPPGEGWDGVYTMESK